MSLIHAVTHHGGGGGGGNNVPVGTTYSAAAGELSSDGDLALFESSAGRVAVIEQLSATVDRVRSVDLTNWSEGDGGITELTTDAIDGTSGGLQISQGAVALDMFGPLTIADAQQFLLIFEVDFACPTLALGQGAWVGFRAPDDDAAFGGGYECVDAVAPNFNHASLFEDTIAAPNITSTVSGIYEDPTNPNGTSGILVCSISIIKGATTGFQRGMADWTGVGNAREINASRAMAELRNATNTQVFLYAESQGQAGFGVTFKRAFLGAK